ncbi:MAG: hypothetical protein ACRDNL_03250, partial [Spirillospora sp.]
ARHRPVAVTPVDDPLRDGTVTTVESDGFEQSGKVLRKAAVSVGRLPDAGRDTSETRDTPETKAKSETKAENGSNGAGLPVKAGSSRRHSAGNGETMTPDTRVKPDTRTDG